MNELETARVYSYQELNDLGYYSNQLTEMVRNNQLKRLQRGFYIACSNDILENIIQLFPEAILCLESAMYFYGYLKELPEEIPLAVYKSANRNKYSHSSYNIRAYFRDDKYIDVGKTAQTYHGYKCFVYNKERLICDCIRKKKTLSNETYRQVMKKYQNDPEKNIPRLREYAEMLHIKDKVELLIDTMF